LPSGSWAATLRGVYYESNILDQDFDDSEAWFDLQIQACQVSEGGAHKAFNCVKGGTLKVSGLLQSSKIMTNRWPRYFHLDRASRKVRGWLDDWDDWCTILQPCWYVRIGTWRHHLGDNVSPWTYNLRTHYMVLQETGNNALEFRRVGLGWSDWVSEDGQNKEESQKMIDFTIV
jgi:hypothetical protein